MAEPIQPIQPSYPQPQPSANVPALSKQMQDQVLELADQLQKVLEDPTLSEQPAFLSDFAKNAVHLHRTVEQVIVIR